MAGRTEKTRFMARGLKTNSDYDFQVIAVNKAMMSLAHDVSDKTDMSAVTTGTLGALGSLGLPLIIESARKGFKDSEKYDIALEHMSNTKILLLLGLSVVALPVSFALAPVTTPVLGVAIAVSAKQEWPEESDDESQVEIPTL